NPNNPTGSYLTSAELDRLARELPPHVLLIVDSAYAEYANGTPDYDDGLKRVAEQGNVAMLRTFSKAYGLAALRVGWGYFPASVADALNRLRGPFNVSAPAQHAAIAALGAQDFIAQSRAHNDKWRAWISAEMEKLGLKVFP